MNKTNANIIKRKHISPTSDEEKIALCKRWKASNKSLKIFSEEHDIPKTTLYSWYKKFFSNDDIELTPGFIQLTPNSKQQNVEEKVSMELKLNNGAILLLSLSVAEMVILIEELNHAATVIR